MMLTGTPGDRAVRERAYRLADSGRFVAVHEIEQALVGEGWPNARAALQSDYARKAIQERLASHAH